MLATAGACCCSTSMADHGVHSSGRQAFRPQVSAEITLPEAGVYMLVGQLRRGDALILAPFYISCAGNSTRTTVSNSSAVGAGGSRTSNAFSGATRSPAAAALAALALQLLLQLL
jgi:hypothetical protein